MFRIHRLFVTASILLCLLSAAVRAQDKTYAIKLDRPNKVGDKYRIKGTDSQDQTMTLTMGGVKQAPQGESLSIAYELTAEVLKVDDHGRPTQLTLTFDSLANVAADGKKEPLLAKGSVVTMEAKGPGPKSLQLQGGALTDGATKALHLLDDLVTSGNEPNTDEVFGTPVPQKVGAKWPVDVQKLVKSMTDSGLQIDALKAVGQTTLQETKTVEGVPCLDVEAVVTFKDVQPPMPPGAKMNRGDMTMKFGGLIPQDTARQDPAVLHGRLDADIEMSAATGQGEVKMSMSMKKAMDRQYLAAK